MDTFIKGWMSIPVIIFQGIFFYLSPQPPFQNPAFWPSCFEFVRKRLLTLITEPLEDWKSRLGYALFCMKSFQQSRVVDTPSSLAIIFKSCAAQLGNSMTSISGHRIKCFYFVLKVSSNSQIMSWLYFGSLVYELIKMRPNFRKQAA